MSQLQWGQPVDGWELSLSLDKDKFVAGEPVMATLVTKNASGQTQPLPVQSRWTTFQFKVRDAGGDVPPTRFGKRMDDVRLMAGRGDAEIAAGDTLTLEILLSRVVDLSPTGEYKVTASRQVGRRPNGQDINVTSNEIAFEITED